MSTTPGASVSEPIYTIEQAAAAIGVSASTIWRWEKEGQIIGTRLLNRLVFTARQIEACRSRTRSQQDHSRTINSNQKRR